MRSLCQYGRLHNLLLLQPAKGLVGEKKRERGRERERQRERERGRGGGGGVIAGWACRTQSNNYNPFAPVL